MKIKKKTIVIGLLAALPAAILAIVFILNSGKSLNVLESSKEQAINLPNEKSNDQESEAQSTLNIPSNLPAEVKTLNLEPVSGKSGQATIVIVEDKENGSFVVNVEANLEDLPKAQNYTSWLVKKGSSEVIPTGNLNKMHGRYILSASIYGNLADYVTILITQETKDDNTPEVKIFEKSL